MRRASIPFAMSEGFHPLPRLMIAQSLSLGIVGCNEAADIELTCPVVPDDLLALLRAQAPAGLEILSIRRIPLKTTAVPCGMVYTVELPDPAPADLPGRVAGINGRAELWVERVRPQPREVNIRPFVRAASILGACDSARYGRLSLDFRVLPQGTARVDELLRLCGLERLLTDGSRVERSELHLLDERPEGFAPEAVDLPEPMHRPLPPAASSPVSNPVPASRPETATTSWGASPNGPVTE